MIRTLRIEPEAEAELEHSAEYYEQAAVGLGKEYLAEMRQRTYALLESAHRHPSFSGVPGVQCAYPTGRFPHLIVYMQQTDVVHILAYMHPRQQPGYWLHRLP
jgi:toxin ParE1/3/4